MNNNNNNPPFLKESLLYFGLFDKTKTESENTLKNMNKLTLKNIYKKYIRNKIINSNQSLELEKYNYFNAIHYKILEFYVLMDMNEKLDKTYIDKLNKKVSDRYIKIFMNK